MASATSLSSKDSAVFTALFDAESSPSSGIKIDSSLPYLPHVSESELPGLKELELAAIRPLQPAENEGENTTPRRETIEKSIEDLSAIITDHPTYAPAYANRAQALRMLIDNNGGLFDHCNTTNATLLFSDLGQTISLATPNSPAAALSERQAQILADAHTHRGYLLYKAAKLVSTSSLEQLQGGPEKLRDLDKDQLEEMASRDFSLGGRYGNKIAQQMAVQTNPYAKMCGAIVKEAMRKEQEEYTSSLESY
ncbi:hypothetical protein FQN54_001613 [Arachnomyces sp. PD_36]|nr:hypothetical protein FQN54_001613 [Arachnomyces sp. PD_36]